MSKKIAQEKRSRYGIKWKMYAILIGFLGITVGVIWFFQIQMMSYFYQINKFNELEKTSLTISAELDDELRLEQLVNQHSREYYEDIWVCRIIDDSPRIWIHSKSSADSVRDRVALGLKDLYNRAKLNDGKYIALFTVGTSDRDSNIYVVEDNMGEPEKFPFRWTGSDRVRVVYASINTLGDDTYMIVQSANLTLVQAIINTMRHQFIWTGIFLAILALITAGIMSKVITKPIVEINESAKKLAKGDYNADFSTKGYREIEELAQTLDYAANELSVTNDLQKELISNVSHDLRTPLTMIKGYAEVMRDIPGENTAENIQIIIDETSRLSDLVNDILDLSKIQSGTRGIEPSYFSITQTVRDTMKRYERLTMQDGYIIEFNADDDVWVYADRGMILQVIYNLINNAINYTGEDKYVRVDQIVNNGCVRINITDTGEGIAEDELSVIWERYYRVDKVHKRATVGTGLGLSIVKQALDLNKARYGVESVLNKGSTFWFELDIDANKSDLTKNSEYIEANYENQENDEK